MSNAFFSMTEFDSHRAKVRVAMDDTDIDLLLVPAPATSTT